MKALIGTCVIGGVVTGAAGITTAAAATWTAVEGLAAAKGALEGWLSGKTLLSSSVKSTLDQLESDLTAQVDAHFASAPHEYRNDDTRHLIGEMVIATQITNTAVIGSNPTAEAAAARLFDNLPDDPRFSDPSIRTLYLSIVTTVLARLMNNPAFDANFARELREAMFGQLDAIKNDTTVLLDLAAARDAKLDALLAGFQRPEGLSLDALLALARRIKDQITDRDAAQRELERAVNIALNVLHEGLRGSNLDDFVTDILGRLAALTAEGRLDEAGATISDALAEAEDGMHLAQARTLRLLDAALEQDILRRDHSAASTHLLRKLELNHPADSTRFPALHALQSEWYTAGHDKGLNFDLSVAIALARHALTVAQTTDERGATLNNLGSALVTLGDRSGNTAQLEAAITAYHDALTERTRDRVPLDWAGTQNNLGNALTTLGARSGNTALLDEAVTAYRAALTERTRDRVPLDWAITQGNLASVEIIYFLLTDAPARLITAQTHAEAALAVFNETGAAHYEAIARKQLTQIAALRSPAAP